MVWKITGLYNTQQVVVHIMEFLQYTLALLVTLGILVTFHEAGHFVVARWSGVKIKRFSVGFGKPIWSRFDKRGTEFAIAAIPLGGYVRMLDEREGPGSPEEAEFSFNRLSVWWRIAIALGGPLANFLLAILVYWGIFVTGTSELVPVTGAVAENTPGFDAGIEPGLEIVSIDGQETLSWSQVSVSLAARLGDSGTVDIETRRPGETSSRHHLLKIQRWHQGEDEPDLLGSLGISPTLPAVMGEILPDSPAAKAGLKQWDRIVSVDDKSVSNWNDWVKIVQAAPGEMLAVTLERNGQLLPVSLEPEVKTAPDGSRYGLVGVKPLIREIRYGLFGSIGRSVEKTWDTTLLTLGLVKKMITGQVSTSNLSGPITIARVAGDSAGMGLGYYLSVLALLSVSLGVLNLLPIPILDGGHVLFCLMELVSGRPVSERIQAFGMQIGLVLVGGLMFLAFYNDITRLF